MMGKTTYFYPNKTLRLGGKILDLSTPGIMGILNLTPDSFYDGGKFDTPESAMKQAEKMIADGADIIDAGGMSSKPGAKIIDADEESDRVIPLLKSLTNHFPGFPFSIDTIHGKTAERAIDAGAVMINDISAGKFDKSIIDVAAKNKLPYVVMHMQGSPAEMQDEPKYENVTREVFDFLLQKSKEVRNAGVADIIIDPGFGFGKSLEHNYQLVREFEIFKQIGLPVLAGISRKSIICKLLKINPEHALNGSTSLHTILLLKGADILRVHDVKEAMEVIKIVGQMNPVQN